MSIKDTLAIPYYAYGDNQAACEAFSALRDAAAEIERLERLVKMGEAVVNDFMPNIGRCALQDYGRLNTFLLEAAKVRAPKPSTE